MERVQKIIASAGYCSRREAEELITLGIVEVNGRVVALGDKADPESDTIKVDGLVIKTGTEKVYLVMNKPKGVISSTKDDRARKTVVQLIDRSRYKQRIVPVGRLDYNTEGLLILTNDGEFHNMVTHPSNKIRKTYEVKIRGLLSSKTKERLEKGIYLEDGRTAPAEVNILEELENASWIEVIIHEGRNRQVRRMLEAVKHHVVKLKRTAIGDVKLGRLKPGEYREMRKSEIKKLMNAGSDKSRK